VDVLRHGKISAWSGTLASSSLPLPDYRRRRQGPAGRPGLGLSWHAQLCARGWLRVARGATGPAL